MQLVTVGAELLRHIQLASLRLAGISDKNNNPAKVLRVYRSRSATSLLNAETKQLTLGLDPEQQESSSQAEPGFKCQVIELNPFGTKCLT